MIDRPSGRIETAALVAMTAHAAVGQRRKYTNAPYHEHCAEVAGIVARIAHDEDMLCAAWLHDTVEDTQLTHDFIAGLFGPRVARLVEGLTDIARPEDGDRAARKRIDRERLALEEAAVQTIKLADMISNLSTIAARDPGYARVYMAEKRALLAVLTRGDAGLRAEVAALLGAQAAADPH